MKHRVISFAVLLLACAFGLRAEVVPVKNGRARGRIVTENVAQCGEAAALLQDFVKRITGASLPIETLDSQKPKANDIVIRMAGSIGEDGFKIETNRDILTITGGPDKGAIYGVVTLLENYLGVDYWAANEYSLLKRNTIRFPDINLEQTPAFRYRQSQNYGLDVDPIYRIWMRLEEPRDEFAASYWVHTFDRLLPSAVYGPSHPEYYSWINGERRPGQASQWCLTNPEVFEIVAARIDSIFEANPGQNTISVSQNDGNFTYCTCEECAAVTEEEGSPSGNYIRFLNKLAARRPDKQFSTLAYLFTMQPPRHTKPLPNVNIMLCDIDAKREVPLTGSDTGRDFIKAIEGWSAISDNIFVWDYGINFDNYVAPFPNFPILQPNIRLFRDHNAKMHFSQIASTYGGDFAELRTYIVSKLMWNPDVDVDSVTRHFMNGYYGAAAPYLYDYEKLLEGALLASGKELWIYDSPVTHKDGMLNPQLRKRYNELFDRAEAAVKEDSALLKRVRRTRLPLQYSELEIARAEGHATEPENIALLDLFESRMTEYGIPTLNERGNSPTDYCKLYRERYINAPGENLARGAAVEFTIPPTGRYAAGAEKALVDGIYGGSGFVENWIGWEGGDGEFVIDLGQEEKIRKVTGDFLHQLGSWVFLPPEIEVSVSADGKTYQDFGTTAWPEDRDIKVKFEKIGVERPEAVSARYVKMKIKGIPLCPGWHYGVGSPGWVFIDEIEITR